MTLNRFIFGVAFVGLLLGCATACSNSDEPTESLPTQEEGTELSEPTLIGKFVNGEMNGSFACSNFEEYSRKPGQSEWIEYNPSLVGYVVGIDFPRLIVFNNSECLIEFRPNVLEPEPQFYLMDQYWEAYCRKAQQELRIYIRAPYEYHKPENTLKIGSMDYVIEFEGSDQFQLGCYSSDDKGEYRRTACYIADASKSVETDKMVIYDNYQQMRDDVLYRLKEAFGENGDISDTLPFLTTIRFDELEKEMAEMASLFRYW